MAIQSIRLHGPATLTASAAVKYTVPVGQVVTLQHIHVQNASNSSVTFTMSIGTDSPATRLYDAYTIGAKQVLDVFCKYALNPAETIQAYASVASALTLTLDGNALTLYNAPILTPTEYQPWGQWTMHSTIDINQTGSFPDRSGSGHDMSFSGFPSGMSTIPDIVIPNNGIKQPSLTTSQYGQGQGGVGLFDNVEFTCTVRATYLPTYSGADQVLIGADGYIILAAIAGTDLMAHTPYTLSKVQTTTALKFLPFRHTFYSVRRRANGVIRFGVNDQFQDVAAPLPPMVYTRFSYGRSLSFGGLVQWPGQIADGSAWSSFLSDADIARYYKLTLGLL